MFSLVWFAMMPAVAGPLSTDPCLERDAVRECGVLQLAVHTERGSFDAYVFSMHHPQAGVFWFQDRDSGAFLRVVAPADDDSAFLGAGWTAMTQDGATYRVDQVLRETYVLRRVTSEEAPVVASK